MNPTDPTHTLKLRIASGRSGVVGAAWLDPNGTLSIQLNPGVVLTHADTVEGATLRAFPKDAS